jgi:trans-aconitate 3-methyltransferase
MSAFAHSSFKAASYLAARPTYPDKLFSYIASYNRQHNASRQSKTASLDIGCGPGEATVPVTKFIDSVTGIDPSPVMIEVASEKYKDIVNLTFMQGSDKNFADKFPAKSLDLVTVAQAVHWFEFPTFFHNAHKVLKPNGTLAFWGYVDHVFVGHPKASQISLDYFYGDDHMGPFWEQPGRNLLRDMLVVAQPPTTIFKDIRRIINDSPEPDPQAVLEISQTLKLAGVLEYMKTASAYHTWKKNNPDKRDACEECIDEIKKAEGWNDETEVTIKWATVLCLATAV